MTTDADDTFDKLLAMQPSGDRAFDARIADDWLQGRGTFGGLVLGLLVRAMERQLDDPRRTLRSLSGQLVGPAVPGPVRLAVELLRAGNAVSTLRATMHQGDELVAHAVAVFGAARPATPAWQLAELQPRPWREVPVLALPAGVAPGFTKHFEFRLVSGPPFMAGPQPHTEGWVRPHARGGKHDAAYVTMLADAYWSAAAVRFEGPRPFATLQYTLELHAPLDGLDPEAPLYHRATAGAVTGGYSSETRELFGEDGRLVALNHQLFVLIK